MSNLILPILNAERNSRWEADRQKNGMANVDAVWSFRPNFAAGLRGPGVDALFVRMFPSIGNRAKQGMRQSVMAALLALAQAAEFSRMSEGLCGFLHKRSTSRLKTVRRYQVCDFSTTQFTKALDALVALGFVEYWNGYKGKNWVSGVTTLWLPQEPFLRWLEENTASLEVKSLRENKEAIVLRDVEKRYQDYSEDDITTAMRERVEAGNNLREQFVWSYVPMADAHSYLEGDQRLTIPSQSLWCYRVFNGDFESGGRFYCGAQGLRKGERATINIDGKPTVELDYKSLHPRLIYNAEGIDAPDDCYASDVRPRELTKLVSLLSINCESIQEAQRALTSKTGLSADVAREHLRSYAEEHSAISHRFFASGWKRLQYLDSQIVDAVLTKAVACDIPVLPVHDSFITSTEHTHWVMDVAAESYKELTGFTTVIDWEPMPDLKAIFDDPD